jgi:catechol 2,3-dioxygenase-like lactoylglutathione lyase family enzyme
MTLRTLTLALACAATTLLPAGIAVAEAASTPAAVPAASTPPAAPPRLGNVGIGVKDLAASKAFYADVLGMQELRRYELGYIEEIVMGYPGDPGTSIVLMHWPNDASRRYDGNDMKLVFYVDDPKAVIERIRARGLKIDREATPIEVLNGRIVGMGRDPDGYVIEVLTR